MKLGLLVAIELDAIFDYYKDIEKLPCPIGYDLYKTVKDGVEIYIIHTGLGEIYAASGVQYLITKFGVQLIVNFGVVGGLTKELKSQKVCLIDNVVHFRYDCSGFMDIKIGQVDKHPSVKIPLDKTLINKALEINPSLRLATCCSSDKFIASEEEKTQIHNDFGGDVCDMESAAVVLTCEANGIPCLMFKAVADGISGGSREFYDELKDASAICLSVADNVISKLNK